MKTPLDTYLKFKEFHRENPGVWDFCIERAREAKELGYERIGFPHIWNLVRWEYGIKKKNAEFAANNDYAPFFARQIMMTCDDLYDFFEVRSSGADELTGWLKFKANKELVSKPKPVKRSHEELLLDEMDERVQRMNYDNY